MCAIEVTPTIGTERLVLRGLVRSDAQQICELLADSRVAAMTANVPHPYGRDDADAFVERGLTRDWNREPGFVIEHRNFGLVGMLGIKLGEAGKPALGFWLGRPFWNRGYATEALRAALTWVKRDWRKKVVVAGHFSDNPASGQVLCKAGFLYTGDVELVPCAARGVDVPTRMMVWLA
jgi:RimJ/RimL family protein N-acetyltransferase